MHSNHQIREFWTGIMAGVFLWLAVGALINFHQQHVFGKAFTLQLNAALSFKKDDRVYAIDKVASSGIQPCSASLIDQNLALEPFQVLLRIISANAAFSAPDASYFTNPSLRAPPLS